jgi:hypothetical protein
MVDLDRNRSLNELQKHTYNLIKVRGHVSNDHEGATSHRFILAVRRSSVVFTDLSGLELDQIA